MEKAVCYEDKRAHFVFSDGTSLVLHPGGTCFTYFSKSGKKSRQLVKFAVNHLAKEDDTVSQSVASQSHRSLAQTQASQTARQMEASVGPLEKLLLAISLFNTYADVPIVARDEIFAGKKTYKATALTKVHWPGMENLADYSSVDKDGNYILKSIDEDLCEIVLSRDCLHFRVSYWQLTDNKEGHWVQAQGDGAHANFPMNLSTIQAEEQQQNLNTLNAGGDFNDNESHYNMMPFSHAKDRREGTCAGFQPMPNLLLSDSKPGSAVKFGVHQPRLSI